MLGRLVLLLVGASALALAQTPPTQCGVWNGATNYLCQGPVPCFDAQQHPQPCALLVAPVFGVVNQCSCVTCTYNATTEACQGSCPYTRVCQLDAVVPRTCSCAAQQQTPAPPPTPPPPCGLFKGDKKTWLCDAPKCADAVNPGTNVPQPRQCGVLELTATGAPAECKCTTCRLDLATKRCTGRCQLGHVCTRGASGLAAETCQCRRKIPIIIGVLIGVVVGVPLVLALVASQL